MRRAAGIVFVFVALVLVALVTFGVVTQASRVGLALLYPLVALFLVPFFWLASRQRAAIYSEGFVPPDRRPREFLAGRERFEPFTEVERVVFVRNALDPSQLLYVVVESKSGRRSTFTPSEVGRDLLQRLIDVAEGRAVPGVTLPREYRVEKV